MKVVDASEISEMGMQWKHKILIHGTVKHMHTKQDGKQPSIAVALKCSCYKKSKPNEKVYHTGGSIHKCCEWKVKIKSAKFESVTIKEVKNAGKNIQKPIFDENIPVIFSKSQCGHTGTCNPSPQHQLVQRSHAGDYLKN